METIIPIILLVAVFYFLLIRPQQKQRRQMTEVQNSLEPGTKVLTGSGLIATVESVEDSEVVLEVAPGITNRFVKRAIVQVVPDEAELPGDTVVPDDASGLTDDDGVSKPLSDNGDDQDKPNS